MENLVWAIILWAAVFILVPVKRIKQLQDFSGLKFHIFPQSFYIHSAILH